MRRTCIFFLFFVGALAAAGCGGSDDTSDTTTHRPATTVDDSAVHPDETDPDETDPDETAADEEAAEDDDAGVGGEAQVALLDAGTEPRQTLRLRPVEGDVQQYTLRQEVGIEQTAGAGMAAISTRTITESDIESAVTASGETFEVASTYADVRVVEATPPEVRSLTQDLLLQMVGQTSRATYTTRGEVIESEMDMPDTDNPMFDQAMSSIESQTEQLAVPFPEEPVGVGAVWTRTGVLEMPMGMSMSTTTTFTLLAVDGDHVRARQELTTVVEGPLGAEVDGELSGVGFVEWDLKLPCPTASSMQTGGTVTISMASVEIEQTQSQVVQVTSR